MAEQVKHRIFKSVKTILFVPIMVDPCHYTFVKPIQLTTLRVNLNVGYGLPVTMTCQCGFITCKFAIVPWEINNGGLGYVLRQGIIWEDSVLAQYCNEPKTSLKIKVY